MFAPLCMSVYAYQFVCRQLLFFLDNNCHVDGGADGGATTILLKMITVTNRI